LLDWLDRQLGLRWTQGELAPAEPAPIPVDASVWIRPQPAQLRALQDAVQLGYYRGILAQLADIESTQPACAAFAAAMRDLARQFQFEAMSRELAKFSLLEEKPQ